MCGGCSRRSTPGFLFLAAFLAAGNRAGRRVRAGFQGLYIQTLSKRKRIGKSRQTRPEPIFGVTAQRSKVERAVISAADRGIPMDSE